MLLATPCDIRIAGESAKIGMGELNLGLPVLMGAGMLSAVYGEAAMRRVILYADFVSGAEALRLNLVTEMVPDDQLLARVTEVAAKMASRNPEAMRMTKASFNGGKRTDAPARACTDARALPLQPRSAVLSVYVPWTAASASTGPCIARSTSAAVKRSGRSRAATSSANRRKK